MQKRAGAQRCNRCTAPPRRVRGAIATRSAQLRRHTYDYDIIIRLIDPEIKIDFGAHGFLLFLVHFAYVHFTSL